MTEREDNVRPGRMASCLCKAVLLSHASLLVELHDLGIELSTTALTDALRPVLRIVPLSVELLVIHALLLDPSEVLEVVHALLVVVGHLDHVIGGEADEASVVLDSILGGVLAAELLETRLVHIHGVSADGHGDVLVSPLEVLGHLDATDHVSDGADAHELKVVEGLLRHLDDITQVGDTGGLVEEVHGAHDDLIIKSNDAIEVLDVEDPWDVLVTDTLDAVVTEAVDEEGRALPGLTCSDLEQRELGAKVLGGRESTSAALGHVDTNKGVTLLCDVVEDLLEGAASDVVVPERVGKLGKLVEGNDLALASADELVVLVEHSLDRALAARGGVHLSADGLEPVEALLRHQSREHSDGRAAKQTAVESATTAVVASAGPESLLACGVKVASDHLLHKRTVRGTDLVGTSGEVAADEHHDASLGASEDGGDLDVVGESVEDTTLHLGLVLPGDTEEVTGVDVPQADALELLDDLGGHLLRVDQHLIGGKENTLLGAALHAVLQRDLRSRHHKFLSRHLCTLHVHKNNNNKKAENLTKKNKTRNQQQKTKKRK